MGSYGNLPGSFAACAAYLGKKQERRIGGVRATTIARMSDGSIGVVYHRTAVVTFFADNTAKIDSGGFETVTTKQRINDSLRDRGVSVYQKAGAWYLTSAGREPVPFYNGAIVSPSGKLSKKLELSSDTIERADPDTVPRMLPRAPRRSAARAANL